MVHRLDPAHLELAYRLAYFIYPEESIAREVTKRAFARLDVTANAQFKRYYYIPTGRTSSRSQASRPFRTKIILKDAHLLQQLIYIETEAYEKNQERALRKSTPSVNDMLVRYIKFLIKTTLRRSSFYVNLGVSRLLHNYSTSDAMELYEFLVADPERLRDSDYYRSRKKQLMGELIDRFGGMLRIVRVGRGERRFQSLENPTRYLGLVKSALERFTPWQTQCVLVDKPSRFESIAGLSFDGVDPDDEHKIEINRVHATVHPRCYRVLTSALGLTSPDDSLDLPSFQLAENGSGDGAGQDLESREAPSVSRDVLDDIQQFVDSAENERDKAEWNWLSIRVDGEEIARLHPDQDKFVTFKAGCFAEMVEVYTPENVLLSMHLIVEPVDEADIQTAAFELENGREIRFEIQASFDSDGLVAGYQVGVGYEARETVAAAVFSRTSFWSRIVAALGFGRGVPVWVPVAAGILVLAVLLQYSLPDIEVNPAVFEETEPTSVPVASEPETPKQETSDPVTSDSSAGLGRTRGESPPTFDGLPLTEITDIMVLPFNGDASLEAFRSLLLQRLQAENRFTLVDNGDNAQAVFKLLALGSEKPALTDLALVNSGGEELWRYKPTRSEGPDVDSTVLVESIMREILDAAGTRPRENQ